MLSICWDISFDGLVDSNAFRALYKRNNQHETFESNIRTVLL